MPTPTLPQPWPYPRWIGHRGAGKLAPENTLAAFRLGASHGYRMFECDVKLSCDDVPFLLHDDTLERTTSGHGSAGAQPWSALSLLDAGSWHSRHYAGEPLLSLQGLARFCQRNQLLLNLEIKPCPGTERHTGTVVGAAVQALWQDAPTPPPLMSSFQIDALRGCQASAPALPRGLLLDAARADWIELAQALGCVAIICRHTLWDAATVAQAQSAGFRTLSYTVNDDDAAQRLIALGTDGLITDRVDHFTPAPAAQS